MIKVVAISNSDAAFGYEKEVFSRTEGVEFKVIDAHDEAALTTMLKDANVILFTAAKLNAKVIDSLDSCKLIIRYGIGYDNVDTERARERGIYVCNAPNYGVVDVAEHAIMLMMSASKRVIRMNDMVRENNWDISNIGASSRLSDKTVGFVGFGKIARAVCERTNAFRMTPVVYDPYVTDEVLSEYGARKVSLDELLALSDFITLHLPLMESTRHMFDMSLFKKMKPSAILINTSRGAIVNEKDLIDALEAGYLGGVGLDVFEDESGKLDPRMLTVRNAVLTPHVAWNTAEATVALHKEVTENVLRYVRGERPESIVNKM